METFMLRCIAGAAPARQKESTHPMLEKPELDDTQISACLQEAYGLAVAQLAFLPLGADQNTAVYRAVAADGRAYFLKLRRDPFDPLSVTLPAYLHEQGIAPDHPAAGNPRRNVCGPSCPPLPSSSTPLSTGATAITWSSGAPVGGPLARRSNNCTR